MAILCHPKILISYVCSCGLYCYLYKSVPGDAKSLGSASKDSELTLGQTGL